MKKTLIFQDGPTLEEIKKYFESQRKNQLKPPNMRNAAAQKGQPNTGLSMEVSSGTLTAKLFRE